MKSTIKASSEGTQGRRRDYIVRGALPWVSNLSTDHFFGTIFEREEERGGPVMFLADCSDRLYPAALQPFLAMDGTGTYGVQFRDVRPDDLIIADPAGPLAKKSAGCLQAGMALGLIKDCIQIMDEPTLRSTRQPPLPRQPHCSTPSMPSSRR